MKILYLYLFLIGFSLVYFQKVNAQYCIPLQVEEIDFQAIPRFATVKAEWYPSWIEYQRGEKVYPESLKSLPKWDHPFMKDGLPSAMHEDSYASDISNMQGPIPENATVQYFQVREKGKEFSGMCPSFAFVDEHTMVTLSFGRANTTLLLIDIEDTLFILVICFNFFPFFLQFIINEGKK